ncbi:uncharacterized protein EAF01_010048 [Botrytis porri]|uniref:BTB domain-containing protein n=1 Tax=Botrytis porri TaxID=87229 RepID=A0A4Z1KIT9_9HELO|nr:uncharacterized protein EAF01_010048 [Botrytis porri]KAF7894598.1 hypothetical protein EAF01_010048 [Botrytis porri]TGO85246.1 hypothetical protein BPOR_0416g00060 [Botrytis porri]
MSPQHEFKIVTSRKKRSDPVVLVVGPEKEVFAISQALLVDSIEYFRIAFLHGHFREGIEKEIYLEDEKPEAIELLVGWLQKSKVNLDFTSETYRNFWELRITADKWCSEKLANDVSDIILALRGSHIPFEHREAWKLSGDDTSAIWRLSLPNSSIRKLCIQCLAWEFREDLDDPRDGTVIGPLIVNRLRDIVDMPDYIAKDIQADFDPSKPCDFQYKYNTSWHEKRVRDRCDFHDHRDGQRKYGEVKYSVDTVDVLDMAGFLIRKPRVNQAWNDGGKKSLIAFSTMEFFDRFLSQ